MTCACIEMHFSMFSCFISCVDCDRWVLEMSLSLFSVHISSVIGYFGDPILQHYFQKKAQSQSGGKRRTTLSKEENVFCLINSYHTIYYVDLHQMNTWKSFIVSDVWCAASHSATNLLVGLNLFQTWLYCLYIQQSMQSTLERYHVPCHCLEN